MKVSLVAEIKETLRLLVAAVNGRLTFTENISCRIVEVVSGPSDGEDFTVTHNLGRIPVTYFVNITEDSIVYDGTDRTEWTDETMTLRCNGNNVPFTLVVL